MGENHNVAIFYTTAKGIFQCWTYNNYLNEIPYQVARVCLGLHVEVVPVVRGLGEGPDADAALPLHQPDQALLLGAHPVDHGQPEGLLHAWWRAEMFVDAGKWQ